MSNAILEFRARRGAVQIPDDTRLGTLPDVFRGTVNGLIFEQAAFNCAGRLMPAYKGGYWDFLRLPADGFYMCLAPERTYRVVCPGNGYAGELSGDAAGIVVCLYVYSNLSFEASGPFRERLAELYHALRDYISAEDSHPELSAILSATD